MLTEFGPRERCFVLDGSPISIGLADKVGGEVSSVFPISNPVF